MSKGYSGLFSGTMGVAVNSTYLTGSSDVESYSDRGIDIPEHIKEHLVHLQNKGDYITGSVGAFSMSDVSIMSKETRVEFAHVTIGDTTYLIRGDVKGTKAMVHGIFIVTHIMTIVFLLIVIKS